MKKLCWILFLAIVTTDLVGQDTLKGKVSKNYTAASSFLLAKGEDSVKYWRLDRAGRIDSFEVISSNQRRTFKVLKNKVLLEDYDTLALFFKDQVISKSDTITISNLKGKEGIFKKHLGWESHYKGQSVGQFLYSFNKDEYVYLLNSTLAIDNNVGLASTLQILCKLDNEVEMEYNNVVNDVGEVFAILFMLTF